MELENKLIVYVGTVRGALAYTQLKKDEHAVFNLSRVDKTETTALQWGRNEKELIIGYKNGAVLLYNTVLNKYTKTIDDLDSEDAVVGLGVVNEKILIGRHNGFVNVWTKMSNSSFNTNLSPDGTMECMVQNRVLCNIIGTGGENNDLKLWDVETEKQIFKAKAMPHDELNLAVKTSVRGICFCSSDPNLVMCATKEGFALLYDQRTQRRPVTKFIEPKASYTTIANCCKPQHCVVGTTKGYIQLLDMRKPGKCAKTFKSFTGGVTSVVCDPILPIVSSTSLDRHFRIHNLDTKQLIYKEYMKQSLTTVIMKPLIKEEAVEEVDNADKEYESLFDNMSEIKEKADRKKRKSSLLNNLKVKKKKCRSDMNRS